MSDAHKQGLRARDAVSFAFIDIFSLDEENIKCRTWRRLYAIL